ncbi:helix-turn-helix domain-containing protein [Paraburkholderia aromaticivorans]|uniref:helix-turn-helix domain-containing protein n=1 Tax=Paraburkholderia aromaticivorans TaxID=2026199 RepID=UPI0038BC315F
MIGTEAWLTRLLLMLVRHTRLSSSDNHDEAANEISVTDRFRELIDLHYRQNLPLRAYAAKLAISLVQLRAACACTTGQSPAKMIYSRIITEAKGNLIFGEMSVEQIASGLGFSDAAYFTRFFCMEVGQAPSQFRLTARE